MDTLQPDPRLRTLAYVLPVLAALLMLAQSTSAQPSFSETKLTAGAPTTNDKFGISVSMEGDTIVVGAVETPGSRPGSAYVFQRSGTTWSQQAKLTASDGAADDIFGRSTSISGDTIVIGAPFDDDAGEKSGSVYVFQHSGTTWTQQAKLTASDAEAMANFGISVSIDGDTIVVGANYISQANPGAAYIFHRSGTIWSQQAKLAASDAAAMDEFGGSVSIDGDTVVVGSRRDDHSSHTDIGSAYVFQRSGTTWSQQAKLIAGDGGTFSLLGTSVSIDGDTILTGAVFDNVTGSNKGSAYIFERSGTTWSQQAKLTASDGAHADEFGGYVSLDGDIAVISARFDDDAGSQSGSAYIFERRGMTWGQQAKLTASDASASDLFGYDVSISGNTLVVGAGNQTNHGGAEAGAAYVFEILPSNQAPTLSSEQPTAEVNEGQTAVNTGSVNDPDGDTVTLTASAGTVTNNNDGTWSWSFDASDGPAESQTVTIEADDGNGGTAQITFELSVNNLAPTATFASNGPVDEGTSFNISLTSPFDPSSVDTTSGFTYVFDCGDGGGLGAFSASSTTVCTTDDDGVRAVKGQIKDKDGGVTEYTAIVTVNNVAPTVETITVPTDPIDINDQPVTGVRATFSDPANSSDEPYNCTVDYDDGGGPQAGTVVGTTCTGPNQTYSEPGVYEVTFTVTDKDNDNGSATAIDFIVIYDPAGGFVTGGGWIDSPAGACPVYCNDATGKASFGFVSKYKKGASVPIGQTEFQFKAGDLDFHSTNYQWLVINQRGTNAQYKGSGTINGDPGPGDGYHFMIWATDQDPAGNDTFRIKIWYEDTNGSESIVYDNGIDHEIGAGNVVIHK